MDFILLCLSFYFITYICVKWVNENYYRDLLASSWCPSISGFFILRSLYSPCLKNEVTFTIAWDGLYAFSSSFLTEGWVSLSCPWAVQMGKLTLKEFCSCDNYPQCSHLWNAKYQWHLIRLGKRTACATSLILVQPAVIVWKCMNACISVRYMHVCAVNVERKQNALVSVKQEVPLTL